MKYDKTVLRATAVEVKSAWEKAVATEYAKRMEAYRKELKAWQEVGKPANIEMLQRALTATKKDLPVDGYRLYNKMKTSPTEPAAPEVQCHAQVKALASLIELLDTVSDDDLTSTALSLAGIKDLSKILRRPC